MEVEIDARGKACPIPVIMAKKEIDGGNNAFAIKVDNKTAVENLKRLALGNDFNIELVEKENADYLLKFVKTDGIGETYGAVTKNEKACVIVKTPVIDDSAAGESWAVFIGKEGVGHGDSELSATLMKMYLYTLKEGSNIPAYILFMNDGVKIPASKGQAADHLKELAVRGVEILVCGACLNFYDLENKLEAGTVSNMYDIVEAMHRVNKVITI